AGVRKFEVVLERVEYLREQRLEIAGTIDSLRNQLESSDLRPHAIDRYVLFRFVHGFREKSRNELDRFNREDVGSNQPEHAAHACVRSNGIDTQSHPVEQRTIFFGTQEFEAQAVCL